MDKLHAVDTWRIGVFGLADKALAVGDMASACWRSTWFSDSKLESFSSSLSLVTEKLKKWNKRT